MSERQKCLVCGNTSLIEHFDLGIHPFADTFVANSDLTKQEFRQNLVGQLCHACSHSQLKFVTNPSERYIDRVLLHIIKLVIRARLESLPMMF